MSTRLAVRLPILLAALASAGAASAGPAATAPGRPLILALIPQAPPVAMHGRWTPFVERLSALAGVRIELKLYEDMGSFERDYLAGVPDLLFAHPSMSAAAHLAQGYAPLVRDRTEITGLLVVRKDAPFRTVQDLGHRRIAFVGDRAFCSIITRDLMSAAQAARSFQALNAGSTRNVLKAVVLGKADAGASLDVALDAEPADLRAELRTLATTRPMAPHPLGAHPRVPAEVRERIAAAVLSMAGAPADRALLSSVRLTDPVRADYARDYRALEREAPAMDTVR